MQTIRNMLLINKHQLDDELQNDAYVADQISQQLTRAQAKMDAAKAEVARTEARLYAELKDSNDKLTEAGVKAAIVRHPTMVSAEGQLQAFSHDYRQWLLLREDWKTRHFDIRGLAQLHTDGYFAATSTSITDKGGRERGMDAGMQRMRTRENATMLPPGREPEEPSTGRVRTRTTQVRSTG